VLLAQAVSAFAVYLVPALLAVSAMGKRPPPKSSPGSSAKAPRRQLKAKTPDAQVDAAQKSADQKLQDDNMCVKVLAQVHDALETINKDAIFAGVMDMEPLRIGDGGMQAPFSQEEFNNVLSTPPETNSFDHFYLCGGNFPWQSFTWLVNHRVPMNHGQIAELQRFSYKRDDPPDRLEFNVAACVDSANTDVLSHKGAMMRLSSPEPVFAVLFSIAKAIQEGVDEKIRMRWQRLIEAGVVSHMSCRQWAYDITGFKAAKERELQKSISSLVLAKMYNAKITFAGGANKITISDSFIGSAATVFERVLSQETARHWQEWAEEKMLGECPFKTIAALQALVDRARSPVYISWAVWGIADLWRMELITLGDLSGKKMKDYRTSYMKQYCLYTWLPTLGLKVEQVHKLQEVFEDFGSVRAKMSAYPGEVADATWLVVWRSEGLNKIADILEDFIYTVNWDMRYKDAVRSKHKINEFLEYDSVQEKLNEIKVELAKEMSVAIDCAQGSAGGGTAASATATETATPEAAPSGFESLPESEQEQWVKYANKLLSTHVELIPEPKTGAELENALKDSKLNEIRGDPVGLVLYCFDVKGHGESEHRPELRIPSLREPIYTKIVRAVLKARAPPGGLGHIRNGEVAIIMDGGRKGNSNKLIAPWKENTSKEQQKKKKEDDDEDEDEEEDDQDDEKGSVTSSILQLVYTEESLKERRLRNKSSTGSVRQTEWAHMVSSSKICLPGRARKHFPGATAGDTIVGITKPDYSREWQISWKVKKELLGKRNIFRVGGKAKGAAERRTDATMGPCTFHGMPNTWYSELIHTLFAKFVIDMTPMDGKFAYQCLINRLGYVGIAFNEFHADELLKKLRAELMDDMKNPESKMHVPAYAKAMGCEAAAKPPPPTDTKAKKRAKGKPKAKPAVKPLEEEEPGEPDGEDVPSEELPNDDEDGEVRDPDA
ncbi:unnamed protein product, partial [Prorocentrum cordatum]